MIPVGINGKLHKYILDSASGCKGNGGEPGNYCFLRDFMMLSGLVDDRAIVQFICMKIYKFNHRIGGELDGWKEARDRWTGRLVDGKFVVPESELVNGKTHAERFGDVYCDGMMPEEVYEKMFPGELKQSKPNSLEERSQQVA